MKDVRLNRLAKQLLHYSVSLKAGEKVLIKAHYSAKPLITELIDETYRLGGYPYVELMDDVVMKHILKGCRAEQLAVDTKWMLQAFRDTDAVILLYGEENEAELSGVPVEKQMLYGRMTNEAHQFLLSKGRWVMVNYPSHSMAQKAGMGLEETEDLFFESCLLDYARMEKDLETLRQLMEQTDRVRILSEGTDLSFSIKGLPAVISAGRKNLPDGEVFTAPVKHSVNGTVTFNTPSWFRGSCFQPLALSFVNGKITGAWSNRPEQLSGILDTDSGSRYLGEFAIGVNPVLKNPVGDSLYDEKMTGSLHLTPGAAYAEADNGNRSAIHWDLVLQQTGEYGGGELYFDDMLIRKDGLFLPPALKGLNPQAGHEPIF